MKRTNRVDKLEICRASSIGIKTEVLWLQSIYECHITHMRFGWSPIFSNFLLSFLAKYQNPNLFATSGDCFSMSTCGYYSRTCEVGHPCKPATCHSWPLLRNRKIPRLNIRSHYFLTWPLVFVVSWPQFHIQCYALYEGRSEINASYFIMLAHDVRGEYCWYGSRGWPFPPIFR